VVVENLLTDYHHRRKHVFADIDPYQCTFIGCQSPDLTYADRKQWAIHEDQHRCTFHCGLPGHESYTDKMHFVRHFQQSHGTRLNAESSMSLAVFQRPPRQDTDQLCPFCRQDVNGVNAHIARHLERLALFALPRTYDDPAENKSNSQVQGSVVPSAGHSGDTSQASKDSQNSQQIWDDNNPDEDTHDIMEMQAITDVPDSEVATWAEVKPELSTVTDEIPSHGEPQSEIEEAVIKATEEHLNAESSKVDDNVCETVGIKSTDAGT
jgi:hypothetical protein